MLFNKEFIHVDFVFYLGMYIKLWKGEVSVKEKFLLC